MFLRLSKIEKLKMKGSKVICEDNYRQSNGQEIFAKECSGMVKTAKYSAV